MLKKRDEEKEEYTHTRMRSKVKREGQKTKTGIDGKVLSILIAIRISGI